MRYLIALLVILTASPAAAGPAAKRMMAVMGTPATHTPFTINGYTSISSDATNDTGTESMALEAGDVRISASCAGTALGDAVVQFVVGGNTATLACNFNESKTQVLSHTVTAGTYNVRVVGAVAENASFAASGFRKPLP